MISREIIILMIELITIVAKASMGHQKAFSFESGF